MVGSGEGALDRSGGHDATVDLKSQIVGVCVKSIDQSRFHIALDNTPHFDLILRPSFKVDLQGSLIFHSLTSFGLDFSDDLTRATLDQWFWCPPLMSILVLNEWHVSTPVCDSVRHRRCSRKDVEPCV